MKIMLCDDDEQDLQTLERLIKYYCNIGRLEPADIRTTRSANSLIKDLRAGKYGDIYILDIMMEEKDGISLGEEIRRIHPESIIIYVTSSPEFALGAFGIWASGYLLKPVEETRFAACMDHVMKQFPEKEERLLMIKSKEGIITINRNKLMRVENVSRVLHYYMEDGSVIESVYIRQPFEDQLKELLQDFRFIQPHKSFVINAEYVEKMVHRDFVMTDKSVVPISRAGQAMVKKRYLEYLSKTLG